MNRTLLRSLVAATSLSMISGAFATNLLVNGDFEIATGPMYSSAPNDWGGAGGLGFGGSGGWASHANHPAPNNETLGKNFCYYSPEAGTEYVGQRVLNTLYEAGKTYTFKAWSTNGGNSHVVFELGYANVLDDPSTWVDLGKVVYDITGEWAPYAGVTVQIALGDAAVGKQILARFGQTGTIASGGAWVDNASLEVVPEPATLAVLGLGSLIAIRRRKA